MRSIGAELHGAEGSPILGAGTGFGVACLVRHEAQAIPLSLFCSIYGAVAGDIALAHGARGGVIVAGGIAQKIEPLLLASAFREHFEKKGRLSHYIKAIPTKLLSDPDAALRGVARAAVETWGR